MSHNAIADATVVRDSVAGYLDSNLAIASEIANEPRDSAHYNAGRSGLLLEGGSTNLLLHSEELSDAYWTKTEATISADATAAPDAAVTADKIVESANIADHLVQRAATLSASTFYTLSGFFKQAERTWVRLTIVIKDGTSKSAWFNLATGAVGSTPSGGVTARISALLKNGFYRCSISVSAGAGGSSTFAEIHMATADNESSYDGDAASGVYGWGLQLEAKRVPTAYIKTIAATVDRAADSISWAFPLTPQAMTIYARLVELGLLLESGRAVHVGDASTDDPSVYVGSDGTNYTVKHTNSSNVSSAVATAVVGDVVELRAVLYPSGAVQMFVSVNGGSESSGSKSAGLALAVAWSAEQIWLNGREAASPGYALYQRVKVARGVQSRTYMRAFGSN